MQNNWKLSTIIVAVRDMDKAVEHYGSLGITGFSPEFLIDRRTLYTDLKISNPKELTGTVKLRVAPLGPVRFELSQPVEGQPFQKDFLDSKGEGVVQIVFTVDNIEEETAKMVKKGFPVVVSGKRDIGSIAIFDTCKVGGVYIELVQRNK